MQHQKINTVRQGRNTLTVTTTTDDESTIETQELVMTKGRRVTQRTTFARDTATNTLISVDGAPVKPISAMDTLREKLIHYAADAVDAITKRDPNEPLVTTTRRKRTLAEPEKT